MSGAVAQIQATQPDPVNKNMYKGICFTYAIITSSCEAPAPSPRRLLILGPRKGVTAVSAEV